MILGEMLDTLEGRGEYDTTVLVRINGVDHDIHDVEENSQGLILIVDTDEEERSMR